MALFGSSRDISFFKKVNYELLDNVIQQEVDYYQLVLDETKPNLYGETTSGKFYYAPVRLTCLIERGDIEAVQDDQFGIDQIQRNTFRFLHAKMVELNLFPQMGDIIENRNNFYEVDNVNENQFIVGKDPDYPKNVGTEFGESFSLILQTHFTRVSKLQIVKAR
jgi:hypothetical protein